MGDNPIQLSLCAFAPKPTRGNRAASAIRGKRGVEKAKARYALYALCANMGELLRGFSGIQRSQTGGSIVKYHTKTIIASRISATDRK